MPNNYKSCRIAKGYSQKFVALTLNVAPPSVCAWQSGKTQPSTQNLQKLADLYEVSVDTLLGRESIPSSSNPEADAVRTAYIEADPITQGIVCDILHVSRPNKKTAGA